jgi:hypothetical protein
VHHLPHLRASLSSTGAATLPTEQRLIQTHPLQSSVMDQTSATLYPRTQDADVYPTYTTERTPRPTIHAIEAGCSQIRSRSADNRRREPVYGHICEHDGPTTPVRKLVPQRSKLRRPQRFIVLQVSIPRCLLRIATGIPNSDAPACIVGQPAQPLPPHRFSRAARLSNLLAAVTPWTKPEIRDFSSPSACPPVQLLFSELLFHAERPTRRTTHEHSAYAPHGAAETWRPHLSSTQR